jgi:hypothetical protein
MTPYDFDDQSEDLSAILEPAFSIEPDEWLELDLESMCIN